jgi:microcystin-dependent protein
MSDPFIGEIKMVGFNYAPYGWAFCNGQLVPIVQNTALFSLLGTVYGGDGKTNFALPNLQGRVPVHSGSSAGQGLSRRDPGQTGGCPTVALSLAQLPAHSHLPMGVTGNDAASPENNTWGTLPGGRVPSPAYQSAAPNVTMNGGALDPAGSATPSPHNNMQPYLAVNFIIAMSGIYPVRE